MTCMKGVWRGPCFYDSGLYAHALTHNHDGRSGVPASVCMHAYAVRLYTVGHGLRSCRGTACGRGLHVRQAHPNT
jgi:hypothetical protein